MGLTLFVLILETLSVLLNDPDLKRFIVFNKVVNVLGFIVTPIIPFLVYIFIREWINLHQKEQIKRNKILLLPLAINGVSAFMSYSRGLLFHITSNNIYERGHWFFILPCVCYFYFGYNLWFVYKHRKKLTSSKLIVFSLSFIISAIFTGIQIEYFTYLTTWNSAAIVVVVAYIVILNEHAYRDGLTGLENRLDYEHYARKINYKMINKLFMVYIDLDNLKTINDKYGHCEGDEVIKIFSSLLYPSFPIKHKKLVRLGGDEFLIILEGQEREKVEGYMKNLIELIEEFNNRGEKPYKITFSNGIGCYTKAYENFGDLLEYTDKMMYVQKQRKKSLINI